MSEILLLGFPQVVQERAGRPDGDKLTLYAKRFQRSRLKLL